MVRVGLKPPWGYNTPTSSLIFQEVIVKKTIIVLFLWLTACAQPTLTDLTPTAVTVATAMARPTSTTTTTPSLTPTATHTPTAIPTNTPLPTKYADGTLNCPGSVALMYHTINPLPDKSTDFLENNSDIGSFEKVVNYLLSQGYYFPTPEEFSSDIKSGVCKHKYAIIIIDDSWNDPEEMGVTQVLQRAGGGTEPGLPKVWFALITRQLTLKTDEDGNVLDQWPHFRELTKQGLVYIVSHSQTHPLPGKGASEADIRRFHKTVGGELLPSRKDIVFHMEVEPHFFVYPGGVIADPIISGLSGAGYAGAFTVWAGSLDKAYRFYLPRINGGSRCGTVGVDNSNCVIEQIEKYSK